MKKLFLGVILLFSMIGCSNDDNPIITGVVLEKKEISNNGKFAKDISHNYYYFKLQSDNGIFAFGVPYMEADKALHNSEVGDTISINERYKIRIK